MSIRRFVALTCCISVSAYGNYLNLIALGLFTYELTGSALGTGVLMAIRLGSGFLAGLAAGRLVGMADRGKLMIAADLAQATAMLVLVFVPDLAVLGAAAVVLGAGSTLFTVALRTSIPEMVGQEERTRANGYLVTGRSLATVLGFASAGIIVEAGGFGVAFLVNALSFLVSACALAVLPLRLGRTAVPGKPSMSWRALPPILLAMIVLRGADALGSAAHNVALPVFANLAVPADPAVFMAQFMTSWALGSLFAHQFVSRWPRSFGERAFAVGTCVMSVSFVLAFTGLPSPLLVAVAAMAGLADGFTEIACVSRLQAAPEDQRGRLFALSATAETAGFAVGMLVSSALLEALPVVSVVGMFHGAAFAAACGFLLLLWKGNTSWRKRSAEAPNSS